MLANKGFPLPSRTCTRSMCISSTSPAFRACCRILAELMQTAFEPALALAWLMASSTPVVMNVKGESAFVHSATGWCVTTK
ncbi:hypothetical protein MARINOS108_10435 [Marinoscillum sp. 108]|nr:hypothetical protein MARINOS108_10435 [Marinoscillum sp. 108]